MSKTVTFPVQLLINDISSLYSQYFYQHEFLKEEINFFLREFEYKREHRDLQQLQQLHHTLLKHDDFLYDCLLKTDIHCESLIQKLNDVTEVANAQLSKETKFNLEREKMLARHKEHVSSEQKQILATFAEEREAIDRHFVDVSNKLLLNFHHTSRPSPTSSPLPQKLQLATATEATISATATATEATISATTETETSRSTSTTETVIETKTDTATATATPIAPSHNLNEN